GDLVGAAGLLGGGGALTGALLESQRDTVDIAETDRMDRGGVAGAEHRTDAGGRFADRDVDVLAHRRAGHGAVDALVLAVDRDLGAARRGVGAHTGGGGGAGCRRRRRRRFGGRLGLLLARRTAGQAGDDN